MIKTLRQILANQDQFSRELESLARMLTMRLGALDNKHTVDYVWGEVSCPHRGGEYVLIEWENSTENGVGDPVCNGCGEDLRSDMTSEVIRL